MNRKILISIFVIGILALAVGWGTYSYFSDTETSSGNTFTAGTLDLKVNDNDDPNVVHVEIGPIYPGWGTGTEWGRGTYTWILKNVGNLPGLLWIEVTPMINRENGFEEPEKNAPGEDGTDTGELGAYILVAKLNIYDGNTRLRIGSPDGPEFKHGTYYLNYLGGLKLYAPSGSDLGILDPGEDEEFCLVLSLDGNVGNCIQGDSVEFDIIFHLDQIP